MTFDPNDPFAQAALVAIRRFAPSAVLVDIEREAEARLQETLIVRAPWCTGAMSCHRHGWVVFPQESGEKRRPGKIHGRTVRFGEWAERPQTATDITDMLNDSRVARENIAAVMSAKNGCFVIDLDVTVGTITQRIAALAEKRLGRPFIRSYRQSRGKSALIYATDPSDDPVSKKSKHPVMGPDGGVTDHAIEIISGGSPYTIFGRHWKVGSGFTYRDINPLSAGPTAAAVVSATKLRAFLEEVSAEIALLGNLRGYQGTFSDGAVEAATVDVDGLVIPGRISEVRDVTLGPDGKVVDGRESFLRSRAFAYVIRNPGLATTAAGRHALAGRLATEAHERWDGLGSHFRSWHGGSAGTDVLCAARERIESAARTAMSRPDFVERVGSDELGRRSLVQRVAVAAPRDEGLAWLRDDVMSTVSLGSISVEDQAAKRLSRAIVTDQAIRDREQARVAAENRACIDRFVGQTRAKHDGSKAVHPVLLLKAPTGAGKTSLAVEVIATDVERNGPSGPRLFLLPSYNNIAEVEARARMGREARERKDAEAYASMAAASSNEARRRGLRVEVLTGKERGGCLLVEELRFLRSVGQPSPALCHLKERLFVTGASKDDPPVYDETWCRHHPDNPATEGACPVILARRKLAAADIIFSPTTFLTKGLPEGLKDKVTGLIVDERCCFELMNFGVMPLSTLDSGIRGTPILTAKEKAEGVDAEGMVIERDHVAQIARESLLAGRDVAADLAADERLAGMVQSAVTVCGRGQRSAGIKPNVSLAKLQELFAVPQRNGIREEHRFWKLVADRIASIRGTSDKPARGDRDRRIQLLGPGVIQGLVGPAVRLSWMVQPTLSGVPTLLLDASADSDIIGKCWCGREVETVRVEAYMHLRTVVTLDRSWASTSIDVECARDGAHAARIARDVAMLHRMETALAGIFGWGRIATFTAKRVRRALRRAHPEPWNVDSGHYGAVRGLDFAKDHAAVVTIGRLEFPTWIYDALAACLAFDDPEPEAPFDRNGTGFADDGTPIQVPEVSRTLRMRDGRDLTYSVPELPGRWGRAVQRQFREEEQLQCAGRLRPVYRDGEPPIWIAASRVVPEDVVVDAVTTVENLAALQGAAEVHEAIRRVGILDRGVIERVAPDLSARLALALSGSGIASQGQASPVARGLDKYAVRIDGAEREILVPASAPDPVSTAMEAYDLAGHRVETMRLVVKGATPVPSQIRAPDAVDEEMGGRDERRALEEEARDLARKQCPGELSDDPAEIFSSCPPEKLPPRRMVFKSVEVETVLISAGYEPAEAARLVKADVEARAARRLDLGTAKRAARGPAPGRSAG